MLCIHCGKTIHKGLIICSSLKPMKYLERLSLCLNLSDITLLFMSTKFKAIGFLEVAISY